MIKKLLILVFFSVSLFADGVYFSSGTTTLNPSGYSGTFEVIWSTEQSSLTSLSSSSFTSSAHSLCSSYDNAFDSTYFSNLSDKVNDNNYYGFTCREEEMHYSDGTPYIGYVYDAVEIGCAEGYSTPAQSCNPDCFYDGTCSYRFGDGGDIEFVCPDGELQKFGSCSPDRFDPVEPDDNTSDFLIPDDENSCPTDMIYCATLGGCVKDDTFFNYQCDREPEDFDPDTCDDCYKDYYDNAKAFANTCVSQGGIFNPGIPEIYCTPPSTVCSINMLNEYSCTYPNTTPDNNTSDPKTPDNNTSNPTTPTPDNNTSTPTSDNNGTGGFSDGTEGSGAGSFGDDNIGGKLDATNGLLQDIKNNQDNQANTQNDFKNQNNENLNGIKDNINNLNSGLSGFRNENNDNLNAIKNNQKSQTTLLSDMLAELKKNNKATNSIRDNLKGTIKTTISTDSNGSSTSGGDGNGSSDLDMNETNQLILNTNDLLSDINKSLNGGADDNGSSISGIVDKFNNFKNNLSNELNGVLTSAGTIKDSFQNGFELDITPRYSYPTCMNKSVFGQTYKIDLCPILSTFAPFIQFFVEFFVILMSIMIVFKAFTLKARWK